jgi:hypothetical protein
LKNGKYVTSYTTPDGLEAMRSAEDALREIRAVRRSMKEEFGKLADGDPNARLRIEALKESEGKLEGRIEAAATAAAIVNPAHENLLERLKEARQKIAVLKTIDTATDTNGLVSPRKLSLQRESGIPLTKNLEKIALFYNAFRDEAQSAIDAGVINAGGASSNFTLRNLGSKTGWLAGGVPVVGDAARKTVLSDRVQNQFVNPRMVEELNAGTTLLRQGSMLGSMSGVDERPQPSLKLLDMAKTGAFY